MKDKKKIILVSITLIILIIIVCLICFSKKKMTCISEVKDDFRYTKTEIVIHYKKDNIYSVKQTATHEFSTKEALEVYQEYLDEAYETISQEKQVKSKRVVKDNNYQVVLTVKPNELSDKKVSSLELSKSLKGIQEIMEKNTFTCN